MHYFINCNSITYKIVDKKGKKIRKSNYEMNLAFLKKTPQHLLKEMSIIYICLRFVTKFWKSSPK